MLRGSDRTANACLPATRPMGSFQGLAAQRPFLRRFSDAGMTDYPRDVLAGVRKAPRHEIAGWDGGGAAGAMGILPRAQAYEF